MEPSRILRRFDDRRVVTAIMVGLALYAAGSFAIVVVNTLDSTGGTDLFTYWRINHFTRQGDDPYQAFLQDSEIRLPVRYIDGHTAAAYPIADTDVTQKLPGNSPAILFLLFPLTFLSWTTAKVVWMVLSIGFVLATPWLAFRLLAYNLSLPLSAMMALVYYGFPGTRSAIVTGQTSVITIFLVLLTLWLVRNNRNWLGGLALGVALSKFSVAIPLFIFLIYKRNWISLAVGLIVQAVALAAFALLRQGSPLAVFSDFVTIAGGHASLAGIHLTGLFSPTTTISILVGVVFSIVVLVPLWYQVSSQKVQDSHLELRDYTVFGVLCLWSLLVAYHKGYDIGLALAALTVFLYVLSRPSFWGISSGRMVWILPIFFVGILWLSLPIRFIEDVLGLWWEQALTGGATVVLVLLLAASLQFLWQIGRIYPARAGLAR